MTIHELTDHRGADIPSRYYVDGVRVSAVKFEHLKDISLRMFNMTTKGKNLAGGRIRRTNYTTIEV